MPLLAYIYIYILEQRGSMEAFEVQTATEKNIARVRLTLNLTPSSKANLA